MHFSIADPSQTFLSGMDLGLMVVIVVGVVAEKDQSAGGRSSLMDRFLFYFFTKTKDIRAEKKASSPSYWISWNHTLQ